ncbi:peptidase M20 [Thermococcus chitonophagus]|uniref:N-acetyl-L,L-diaminopimelate deacetylase homolog n=1 Tax=Thermococcus chitonophagus TaxID=54262 RepID=A0A160VT07_9EURY|nr:carboxypeptidase CpsA [Thermococcus chitonophagus]ASJ17224.1 peptidase M20 [Thermococcus chitonophagus]CUX77839.1 N-acetyl-L,L-diaminopimelate deacetylase homolog [Thermococcus chitonophagus]
MESKTIIEKARELEEYIIKMRREFHMYPELKYEEVRTSKIIREELEKLGYKIIRTAETGVIGVLKKGNGKTVALRADIDALPIQEENDVPYKSKIPGKMHACGHDAHTAMLLGAARVLREIPFDGTIKLIFQPAEEGGLGAKKIVEEGHLDDVDAIFGIHVWADLPSGVIGIRHGALLASADAFKVRIVGKGGHGAYPHQTIDPIAIAVELVDGYYKIPIREIDPIEPVVISVTSIKAGTTFNVIPEEAEILGTIRTFNEKVRDFIVERMEKITREYADGMRGSAEFTLTMEHIPPTINDEKLAKFAREVLSPLGEIVEPKPSLGAEDFAFYTTKAPGLFVLLGIKNEKKGIIYPHHHPKFDVDEAVLWKGTAIYSLLAIEYLKS